MAKRWEYNNTEYLARLNVFYYLCNNWWRVLLDDDGKQVFTFDNIPSNILDGLSWLQHKKIRDTINCFWELRNHRHAYTIDDILAELQWCFNFNDIKDFKVIYNEPKRK